MKIYLNWFYVLYNSFLSLVLQNLFKQRLSLYFFFSNRVAPFKWLYRQVAALQCSKHLLGNAEDKAAGKKNRVSGT